MQLLAFAHHITGKESAFFLPTAGLGVIEDFSLQCFDDLCLGLVRGLCQIVHPYPTVIVQTAGQCLHRRQDNCCIYLLERYRLVHDIGLHYLVAMLHFDGIDLHTQRIKHDELPVVVVVEEAPFLHETVITAVQFLTVLRMFGTVFALEDRQSEIAFTDGKIICRPILVEGLHLQRHKHYGLLRKRIGTLDAQCSQLLFMKYHRTVLHPREQLTCIFSLASVGLHHIRLGRWHIEEVKQ